ncbi:MAG: outer membrane lipoprotein-sorting protein [Candidatus Omnitrophota bacterium]
MKRIVLLLTLAFFIFNLSPYSFSQEISAKEIVQRSDDLMRGDTQKGKYTMVVTTPDWVRTLKLYVYGKGRDKFFIRILSPAKEKGIATLRIKNEMWNYLPTVERTIKIPPSMMLQPWMGSDFANDDLVKESSVVEDYTHEIIGEEDTQDGKVYCIELTPKPGAGIVWDKRIMRITKKGFIPVRDEFYGKNNKLIKVLNYSNVKRISDRSIPTRWEMASQIKKDSRTIIEVDERLVYNEPVDDSIFSLQNLKSR